MSRRPPIAPAVIVAGLALIIGANAARDLTVEPPAAALAAMPRPGMDTVVKVIDGESFDVRRGDETVRVRLLNVDAPDTATSWMPAECGADTAREWLAERLPAGTRVTIENDNLQYDWYQRELGWVTTSDGRTVNLDIVRAGLAAAVSREPNVAHGPQVAKAQKEAATKKAGLFAPGLECSLGARVSAQIDDLADATRRADLISKVSYERSMRTIGRSMAGVRELRQDLADAGDTAEGRMLGRAAVDRLQNRLEAAVKDASRVENRIVAAEDARIARELAAERERIRRKEAAKKAAEEAAEKAKNSPTSTATPTAPATASPTTGAPTPPAATKPPTTPPKPAATTKP